MTQHKKDHSTESVLKRSAQLRKAIEHAIGKAPKMHADKHEATFRNHLRMRTSVR